MEISVQIGSWRADFILVKTTAPKSYDTICDITIYEESLRYVLILKETLAWHQGRYGSGLYMCEVTDDIPEKMIQEKLVKALYNGFEKETK